MGCLFNFKPPNRLVLKRRAVVGMGFPIGQSSGNRVPGTSSRDKFGQENERKENT